MAGVISAVAEVPKRDWRVWWKLVRGAVSAWIWCTASRTTIPSVTSVL